MARDVGACADHHHTETEMSAYLSFTYNVTDPEGYAKYNPGSLPAIMQTLAAHGGEVLAAGKDGTWVHDKRHVIVLLKFPSVDAAQAWLDDPDYASAKAMRLASTADIHGYIMPEFQMPE